MRISKMSNRVSLPGPQCAVTVIGASDQEVNEVHHILNELEAEAVGKPIGIIDAMIHSSLEAISGDGHAFEYDINYRTYAAPLAGEVS